MVESVDIREMNKDVRVWSLIGGGVARSEHSEINKEVKNLMIKLTPLLENDHKDR